VTIETKQTSDLKKRGRFYSMIMGWLLFTILCLIITSLFFFITPTWWGPRVVGWLQAPEAKVHSDAIIVLGGDAVRRAQTGVDLFQAGLAPQLIITGDNPQRPYRQLTEQAQAYAVANGIPASAILLLSSTNTFEDAQQITRFIQDNNLARVTIVTDWFHSRRAMCSVHQVLSQTSSTNTDLFFWPAQTPFTSQNWWDSKDGIETVSTEFVKSIYYIFDHNIPMWNCWYGDINTSALPSLWLFSGLFSFIIVFVVRQWASRHLLDIPNERSSHSQPIPRGGGVGIVLMTLLPLVIWLIMTHEISSLVWLIFIAVSGLIAIIGWIDDRNSLPAKVRLALQLLLTGVLLMGTGVITHLGLPIIGTIDLGVVVGSVLTAFWIVGLTNAYNFMDGIDGIAGVQAVMAGSVWCLLLVIEGQPTLALLAGLIAASSLGFLALNAPPASIFMGDVGSTFLGFTLAALPVLAYRQMQNPRLWITGAMFVAPFVFDSGLTIIRRVWRRENILAPHRSHLYQRLHRLGYSHRHVTGLYLLLCAISGLCGLLTYAGDDKTAIVSIVTLLAMCAMLAIGVGWLEMRRDRMLSGVPNEAKPALND
jgi:UDP-N-acetylmuramyl pentapeptide phosphotransferase/UDP-N-acetylglucosamine-1-phosphate transferase/uncharacterized SAM-binding protein YcdF (DUF218 family)